MARWTAYARWLLAALGVPFGAAVVQWALWPVIQPYVWFLFFPAVFLSAWLGSLSAGLAATLVSAGLVTWFFVPPEQTLLKPTAAPYLSAIMFLGVGLFICLLHERLRRALAQNARTLAELRTVNGKLSETNAEVTRLYQKTREVDELKSRFFANVSHELRTPIALILGPTERLLEEASLTAAQRHQLDVVVRNAQGLLAQVEALLEVARLEAGKAQLSYAPTDLAELVRQVAANFESVASERELTYEVAAASPIPVEVDLEKVRRILMNLLANAFKFTPAGGRITCEARLAPAGERAVVVVRDTGPGIPPALTERIFERFFQVEGGPTRRFGGTGLGLSISKDFAELHGGRLSAGNAPGGGAVFTLELPLTAPPALKDAQAALPPAPAAAPSGVAGGPARGAEPGRAPGSEPAAPAPVRLRLPGADATEPRMEPRQARDLLRPRVLVVEDNADMRRFIADALAEEFRVELAGDGEEGLAMILEHPPDLVLTDVMMPRLSGADLVVAIRSRSHLAAVPIEMRRGDCLL